jgi:hypothetical protein
VVARDGLSESNSAVAELVVTVPPLIQVQPLGYQETPWGGTATFSVTVSNTATLPIGYRWRKAGISIPGAFYVLSDYTSILTVTNVTNMSPMVYSVMVTNLANRLGLVSLNATNVAVADSDHDGIPDAVETQWGLDPNNPADAAADPDGDTLTNLEEYMAGTDPEDPTSYLRLGHITVDLGIVQIEFPAAAKRTYSVQFTDDLTGGAWTKLGSISARATNFTGAMLDPGSRPGRWYRLVSPAQQR